MKKYKLIKKFPGSGNIGDEYSIKKHINERCYYPESRDHMFGYSKSEVENNPEFWQEVVELDYEILSFKDKGYFVQLFSNELYGESAGIYTAEYFINEGAKIHSIKRLSDNEVFSVGDLIIRQGNNIPIETIELDDTWLKGVAINRKTNPYGGECLDTLRKAKKPLFVTEDQIEIFEGDDFWAINLEKDKSPTIHKLDYQCNYSVARANGILWFSTKETAQSYIDENKPKYSELDMLDFGKYVTIKFDHKKMDNFLNNWKSTNGKK